MTTRFDLVIKDASIPLHDSNGKTLKYEVGDVGIKAGKITGLGPLGQYDAQQKIEGKGLTVLPGVIDSQVHFREPGLTHKEDFASGTRGALLGGVTAVFEMPNTKPATMTALDMADKVGRAKGRAWTHMGFYMGSGINNADRLTELEGVPGCIGIKVFFGSSTGNLLFNDLDKLKLAMSSTKSLISFHCEDEGRLNENSDIKVSMAGNVLGHMQWRDEISALKATEKVLKLALETQRKVHILHVTTRQEMDLLAKHKHLATVEVLPQHLTLFGPECYERLGTKVQMNPPIRTKEHFDALWKAVTAGVVDVIGSDHAPHTLEEKSKPWPESPSGMPGVQTLLPVMLNHVNSGRLSLEHLTDLICVNPAKLAKLNSKGQVKIGFDADLSIIDLGKKMRIESKWLQSKCGWSPFEGMQVQGWPVMTVLNGKTAMRDTELIGGPSGQILKSIVS